MADLSEEQEARIEALAEKYKPRILKQLENTKELLESEGYEVAGPEDLSYSDDYRWTLLVFLNGRPAPDHDTDPDDIDINFEMLISESCDGEENGLTFAVSLVTIGGSPLGGLSPFNYTNEVWVDRGDDEAVEKRFSLFEQVDNAGIVDIVNQAKERS